MEKQTGTQKDKGAHKQKEKQTDRLLDGGVEGTDIYMVRQMYRQTNS